MTLCPYNPTEATECLWGLAGEATMLAVVSLTFTFLFLLFALAVTLPWLFRY